uniref:Uncharacterized protein n=1 Tax=Utricularia reniformis TaxID=192314 RepID=A0A1Y0B343_9LAMI|nr:hypothetical protein AEK19_MT1619 [Utricularia reniformis]ART31803.1 hypothetical protein AEK19_MT1619 [Utricularia reniformis]
MIDFASHVTGILIEQAIEDRWPLREAVGVDRSRQSRKLTVYHTLPLDATALLTLFPASDLREVGSLWFGDQTEIVEDGYDSPV